MTTARTPVESPATTLVNSITQPSKGLVMSCGKKKDGGGKKR